MVALYGLGGAFFRGFGFDDVRVDGALGQVAAVLEFPGFFGEDLDEFLADYFAFGFRFVNAFQFFIEAFRGSGDGEVEAQIFLEHFLDLIGFAVAQKTVVNEDAVEVLADGLVKQHGGHGGVHAAGEA